LAQLIEDALRVSLMRWGHVENRGRVRMITLKESGTRPGIDLEYLRVSYHGSLP